MVKKKQQERVAELKKKPLRKNKNTSARQRPQIFDVESTITWQCQLL